MSYAKQSQVYTMFSSIFYMWDSVELGIETDFEHLVADWIKNNFNLDYRYTDLINRSVWDVFKCSPKG